MAKRATLKKYNFSLNKSEFKDVLHLRYGWEPPNTPHTCPYGQPFRLTHSLHCPKGGYTHLRNNKIRDTFATLLDEVCHNVEIEPKIQSLEKEKFHNKTATTEDDARLDIKANGLCGGRFSRTIFDVKIFNPHAKSCPNTKSELYKYQNIKILTKNSGCRTQQLCSTNFCVYRRRSTRLYKNHPETSIETKRETELLILGHNELYKNKYKFCTSEECNLLP